MQQRQQLKIEFNLIPTYCYCNVAVAPLRSTPSHTAEQITQLLYGEKAKVMEVSDSGWAYVKVAWDGYEGWCRLSQLTEITYKQFGKASKFLVQGHQSRMMVNEQPMLLPLGAELDKAKFVSPHGQQMSFKGKKVAVADVNTNHLEELALQYINAPYQWGGKSVLGIDCSGLTQMVYKMANIPLLRDASQQAQMGTLVDFLETARCGDLAFFNNAEDRIVHVGMLLNNATIIHATEMAGRVVVDKIDGGGIISTSLRKRTHSLRLIKRIVTA
ncbi:MAG: hydrolase Nlp/P60 [Chitinophagia bacterium]|nr:hydrolase Nlp/P60 [Chitinophagia bacterium]